MKARNIAMLLVLLSGERATAQCNMSVAGSYTASCFTADIGWIITNGTPPFNVSITYQGWPDYWTGTSNNPLDGTTLTVGTTFSAVVIISDADGCVASDTLFPDVVHLFGTSDGFIEVDVDGMAGTGMLRWMSGGIPCDAAALTYTIWNPISSVVHATGLVGSAWNFQSLTNEWHYAQALPPGRYSIAITGTVDCGTFYSFPAFDCWGSNQPQQFWVPTPGNPGVNVGLRTQLGGVATTSSGMSDALRMAGLVPLSDPYPGLGYSHTAYTGTGTIPASLLAVTGLDAVVDWLVVELRSPNAPYSVIRSKPALLQRDGDVMDTDGDPFLNFPALAAGQFNIAVRHRNHLGVMTNPAWDMAEAVTMVDMLTYYTGLYGNWFATGSARRLWPGDLNGNGQVKYTGANNDRDPILVAIGGSTPTATITGQYRREDLNLDGVVKYTGANNDRDIILQTVGGTTPTATRSQQMP